MNAVVYSLDSKYELLRYTVGLLECSGSDIVRFSSLKMRVLLSDHLTLLVALFELVQEV